MAVVTFGGLGILLVVRLVEWPVFRSSRPVTPWITQAVCRTNLVILGIRLQSDGAPLRERGALVANHVSWLDIFGLNALSRIYFVAKAEVSGWFGIGWLARATGTLFVERRAAAAKAQLAMLHDRLAKGHKLLFFPEGTSTDGQRVLEFKSTLFSAFSEFAKDEEIWIQPVTQVYKSPPEREDRFFGWWGNMEFGPHFLAVLAAPRGGVIEVFFHEPVRVSEIPDRKALAKHLESVVAQGFEQRQRIAST